MFQTCPVRINTMHPSSTPNCRVGNKATIETITPGRKLRTGMDCKVSSSGIMNRSAFAL